MSWYINSKTNLCIKSNIWLHWPSIGVTNSTFIYGIYYRRLNGKVIHFCKEIVFLSFVLAIDFLMCFEMSVCYIYLIFSITISRLWNFLQQQVEQLTHLTINWLLMFIISQSITWILRRNRNDFILESNNVSYKMSSLSIVGNSNSKYANIDF